MRGPWNCIGDFNDIQGQHEKARGLPKEQRKIVRFNGLINDLSLFNLGCKGPKYTWCNNRQGHVRGHERLDRDIGNVEWVITYPTT